MVNSTLKGALLPELHMVRQKEWTQQLSYPSLSVYCTECFPATWESGPVQHWCHTWSTSEAQHCLDLSIAMVSLVLQKSEKQHPSLGVFENGVLQPKCIWWKRWLPICQKKPIAHIRYIYTYNGSLIFFIDGCCDVQKVTICCFALHMSGRMTGPIFQAHHAHWPSKIHIPTSRSTMQSCISKKQSQSHSILFNVTFLLSYFPCFERPRERVDELCISNFKASETLQQQRAGHVSWTGKNW